MRPAFGLVRYTSTVPIYDVALCCEWAFPDVGCGFGSGCNRGM